ncbi:MAG: helix-turn-helix domain-containing protein [Schleiferiaceae bacterium]|nr:helix-turn-helix domain-containing protein [Schleiferiaceae bacterium]
MREIKGFTQEYMAFELNLSQSQYQRLEANESDLRWSKILQICNILGVTCSQ